MHGCIEVLIVDNHDQYIGRKAILHERDALWLVNIIKTTRCNATVKHKDGALQKAPWNRLSIIEVKGNDRL